MERVRVESRSVVSIGYDPVAARLEVECNGGRVYQYLHVPAAAYRLLLQAPSIGQFMNREIKPRFKAIPI
jgi:hypothetical protein